MPFLKRIWKQDTAGTLFADIGMLIRMRVIPDHDGWHSWEVYGLHGSIAHGRGRSRELLQERCEQAADKAIIKALKDMP